MDNKLSLFISVFDAESFILDTLIRLGPMISALTFPSSLFVFGRGVFLQPDKKEDISVTGLIQLTCKIIFNTFPL